MENHLCKSRGHMWQRHTKSGTDSWECVRCGERTALAQEEMTRSIRIVSRTDVAPLERNI